MFRLSLPLLATCLLACGEPSPSADQPSQTEGARPAASPEAGAPTRSSPETTVVQARPDAAPADGQPQTDAKASPPASAEPTTPGVVPVTTIAPTELAVSWRSLTAPSEALTFVALDHGVLARGASGLYELDEAGQLVLRPELEAWPSDAEPFGEWPDNAWYIERRQADEDDRSEDWDELRLMRLRSGKRWVPQEYAGEQRFRDEGHEFHLGARGGLLVAYDGTLTRVAGGTDDPPIGEHKGSMRSFAETSSGRLYVLSQADSTFWAQRDCADQACVDENALALPAAERWHFGDQVARQRHSVTIVAKATQAGAEASYLLHYETGGWKLEALGSNPAPEAMWPCKDGGLWAKVGAELWHRDPDAVWRKIALPAGTTDFSAAMRGDQSELLLAANLASGPAVFAIHANVQDPAPAAEPATAAG